MNSLRNSPPNFRVCLVKTFVKSARRIYDDGRNRRVVKVACPSDERTVLPPKSKRGNSKFEVAATALIALGKPSDAGSVPWENASDRFTNRPNPALMFRMVVG